MEWGCGKQLTDVEADFARSWLALGRSVGVFCLWVLCGLVSHCGWEEGR